MGKSRSGAELVAACLEAEGVPRVFGIPGAKVDAIFDALSDTQIETVVCRHEQNAAFMAAMCGKLTGTPGVVLVTSGPGVSNLSTALLTATTEGSPVVAIGANVPRDMLLKETHQCTQNAELMRSVTKHSVELYSPDNIAESIANAFRTARMPRAGAAFISFPMDVLSAQTAAIPFRTRPLDLGGTALSQTLAAGAAFVNTAKRPVLLLGAEASRAPVAKAVRALMEKVALPTVCTFQGAGVVPRELLHLFGGRLGLFRNQPGDQLLSASDCVLTVGFDPVEYDPEVWNQGRDRPIVHVDYQPSKLHEAYAPQAELIGDVEENVKALTCALSEQSRARNETFAAEHHTRFVQMLREEPPVARAANASLVHPLHFIRALERHVDDDTIVACDIGSVYMWLARHYLSFRPHHLLFSNGQQTLGVGMPWGMAAKIARPDHRVVSVSGDGGFLFSAAELETAVRLGLNLVHFVWRDGTYNMVAEQEMTKYGRTSGVAFGAVDLPKFANAFGAKGYALKDSADLEDLLTEALNQKGPVLVDIPIDYQDNAALFQTAVQDLGH